MTAAFLEAADWAFFADGSESASAQIGSTNVNPTKGQLTNGVIYHFRHGLEETAGGNAMNQTAQLQYNKNGAGFNNVNAASSNIQSVASGNITDGGDTTQRITAFTFDTTNDGIDEVDGLAGGGAADLGSNGYENLFSIQIINADVSDGDTIVLKIVQEDGTDFDNYQQTNTTITVEKAAATDDIDHPYDDYSGPQPDRTIMIYSYKHGH